MMQNDALEKRHVPLQVRHNNTLHGFNAYTPPGTYLILGIRTYEPNEAAFCAGKPSVAEPDKAVVTQAIRSALGLKQDEYRDFAFLMPDGPWGCPICIPVPLRQRAGVVIDTCRKFGYGICLQTQLQPYYPADKNPPFSKEASEAIAVKYMAKVFADKFQYVYKAKAWLYSDSRLWSTADGRDMAIRFAREFPSKVDLTSNGLCDQNGDGIVCDYDYPAAEVVKKEEVKRDDDDGMPEDCTVCLDAKPNTLVLPCMHQVVCSKCSAKLSKTADAKTCVKCRTPITEIIPT